MFDVVLNNVRTLYINLFLNAYNAFFICCVYKEKLVKDVSYRIQKIATYNLDRKKSI